MSILDRFKVFNKEPFHPATRASALSSSDVADLAEAPRALYVGGAGNIRVTMLDGGEATFLSVPAGSIIPIRISKLWATSTTATAVMGLY